MPNDCWNRMTVVGSKQLIDRFFVDEFKDVPDWAHEIYVKGDEGIQFRMWSRWQPDFAWLESLLVNYPGIWVKNLWYEEGGMAGVWVGSDEKGVKRLEWSEMCIEENQMRFR